MSVEDNVVSEESALLGPKEVDIYDHFSPARKRVILALVSFCGLSALFVSGSFVPCIPQIARDLNTTGSVVNLAVSVSILAVSVSSLFWATYSSYYGRRPIYLAALPFMCMGSLGVATAKTVPQLMAMRVLQAFGSSIGMSVGSGTIGDIYRLEERGTAMGIFFSAILVGPALAPLAGGIATEYFTWRHMQYALAISGLTGFLFIYFFMPETSHPGTRGVDKEREARTRDGVVSSRWRLKLLNPFKALSMLKSPNVLAVTTAGTFVLLTDFILLIPLAYTIGERYKIHNVALIGAFFLPAGLGNMIGAPLAGHLSDKVVVQWRARRKGEWVPEDRLRATFIGGLVFVPLSILLSGFITHYIPGTLGIVLNLICLFMNGIGVDFVLSPSAAYLVDILHSKSAEVMAAAAGYRGILLALITTGTIPSIDKFGVLMTDFMTAIASWLAYGLLLLTIQYGGRMRAWIDVGYTTARPE